MDLHNIIPYIVYNIQYLLELQQICKVNIKEGVLLELPYTWQKHKRWTYIVFHGLIKCNVFLAMISQKWHITDSVGYTISLSMMVRLK